MDLARPRHLGSEHPAADDPPLTFPDLPRLELDQLLAQLVDRAHEVIATQGRLRGLLHANQMITGDLALPVLLRHIVDAAQELVGARYAALGVISRAGGLAQFLHAGMAPETVAAIGDLPRGKVVEMVLANVTKTDDPQAHDAHGLSVRLPLFVPR